ncbi:hypothetical protein B0H19DRAFT_1060140 [Mycena capillaripes]|nr:hypothetical protein B0H19DRAFT_1060140 [Mycena capillaripes]
MTNVPAQTPASRSEPDLEALVALVGCLAVASSEATRIAAEVQAILPLALGKQAAAPSTTWIRGVPKTPGAIEAAFPDGSGEVWYVVIRGREPGLYRTSEEANALTDGVPHQFRRKVTSRREALAFYCENYEASSIYDEVVAAAEAAGTTPPPGVNMGVQKWVALAVAPAELNCSRSVALAWSI